MATAAQIEANRRNAQRSTWPKTDEGKSSARCNALRHGMAALTIVPASPQENPKRLEELTQEWDSDVQPQNAIERNLVRQGARLSLAIERGERIETQMLGAWQRTQIRELGRRLLYIAGPEEVKVSRMPHWADDPGLLVSELEESAEGCRWLLERWEEYRTCWTANRSGIRRFCSGSSGSRVRMLSSRSTTRRSIPSSLPGTCWSRNMPRKAGTCFKK